MAKLEALTTTGSMTMTTDELIVVRLQDLRICDIGLRRVAAKRIKQLTAERDAVQALYDAGTKYWNPVYEKVLHRAEAAEAERDQLREALEQFLIEYDVVDLAHAEPASLTEAVLAARAALKGETP